jgi:RNA polymerase sigma factor (sigma-70 family)
MNPAMSDATDWFRPEYRDYLIRHAERFLADPRVRLRIAPEDLVQEALLKVFQSEFRGTSEVARLAFLSTILRNVFVDLFRKHVETEGRSVKRESTEQDLKKYNQAIDDSFAGLAGMLVADQTSVPTRAAKNELLDRLNQAIAALPSLERQAITLKRDGRTMAEITAEMGITANEVGNIIFRATRLLRAMLKPDTGEK